MFGSLSGWGFLGAGTEAAAECAGVVGLMSTGGGVAEDYDAGLEGFYFPFSVVVVQGYSVACGLVVAFGAVGYVPGE